MFSMTSAIRSATGWTSAGRMRAPTYRGLRVDKDPAEVIREPSPQPSRPG